MAINLLHDRGLPIDLQRLIHLQGLGGPAHQQNGR